jgi:proton-translocating NADH-quinone oxidoreductase chain N
MTDAALLWLLGLPLAGAPMVYLAGQAGIRLGKISTAFWAALAVLLAMWVPFLQAASSLTGMGPGLVEVGQIAFRLDGISLLIAGLSLSLGTAVVIFSSGYQARDEGLDKYYAMLVALVGMMIGLGCAADLFNLWIWFEAMAISSYLLVAYYRQEPASLEAGVKYLVQSAAGSALVLIGIGLILTETGTLDLDLIAARTTDTTILMAASGLLIVGFGVKAALVPFHTWLPDAHSQAPSGISAMLSGVVIEAALVALLRCLGALHGLGHLWGGLLLGFGAANMLLGNLIALKQTQVKRLLAFSSVAHVGYMLVGLGVTAVVGSTAGAQGGFFHMLNHGLMKALAFLAAGALLYGLHRAGGRHDALTVEDLAGAAQRYPIAALSLSLALLSLGGLPPLSGFMSKWQILAAGFQAHNPWLSRLMVLVALNSVLSLAYYAPLVNAVYRRKPSPAVLDGAPLPIPLVIPLLVLALAILGLGAAPNLAAWLFEPAAEALAAGLGG